MGRMAKEKDPHPPAEQQKRPEPKPATFPPVEDKSRGGAPRSIGALGDVTVRLAMQLGKSELFVRDVMELRNGSIVELDKLAGEQIDIYLNDVFFAKGEVVVIGDALAVRITDIAGQEKGDEQRGE
jgi:flagellar motor switch protein FliN/FliY